MLLEDVFSFGGLFTWLLENLIDLGKHFIYIVIGLDLGILQLLVVFKEGFIALLTTRFAELFDVATEGHRNHFWVQTRELFEDRLVHEFLCQSEALNRRKCYVEELRALAGQNVVVTYVAEVNATSSDITSFPLHILRAQWVLTIYYKPITRC